ncbi:hypothetical protein [Actinoalloteichus hymeniacidonis]|uniref:hypothetical protein n=1 Tax=Actinoalloteichus hymeniacidonis TaxID=340345 RepID=UPI000853A2C6|nr:hypothetical protein [Actinoalloteichus hymeniacidonis]MBB5906196.1 hypothetical protein [Actinoalloteichus hymeniacidonis]
MVRRQPRTTRTRRRAGAPWESAPSTAELPDGSTPDSIEDDTVLFRSVGTRAFALGGGLLVLTMSILATGIITSAPGVSDPDDAPQAAALVGPMAMRPDILTEYLAEPQVTPRLDEAAEVGPSGLRAVAEESDRVPPAEQQVISEPLLPVDTDRELVEQFYNVLAEDPQRASRLLGDELRSNGDAGFISAWENVRSFEVVTIREPQAGTVEATVAIDEAHGGRLYLTQQLVVGETPKRITEVKVLTVQQSATS